VMVPLPSLSNGEKASLYSARTDFRLINTLIHGRCKISDKNRSKQREKRGKMYAFLFRPYPA
jgi:hypothetical protein